MTAKIQLEQMMDKLNFGGRDIVSKDQLASIPALPGGYIINLDDSTGQGTHWIALWLADSVALYFDSFGMPPHVAVMNFIRKYGLKRFIYIKKQIQDIRSGYCGQYSIIFLYDIIK